MRSRADGDVSASRGSPRACLPPALNRASSPQNREAPPQARHSARCCVQPDWRFGEFSTDLCHHATIATRWSCIPLAWNRRPERRHEPPQGAVLRSRIRSALGRGKHPHLFLAPSHAPTTDCPHLTAHWWCNTVARRGLCPQDFRSGSEQARRRL